MASNVDTFPTDGNAYQVTHPWDTVWAFVNNSSAVNATVSTDQGFKLTVPPGAGLPWSLPVPTRNLTVQSASNSAGGIIYVTASDSLAGAQSYASNIVTGTVNANILNSNLTVTASGTVNANILNSSISANITNATLSVADSLVETNTSVLTGILPKNIAAFTLTNNVAFTQTIAAAIDGFALDLVIQDGFLNIFYTASSKIFYLVRNFAFIASGIVPDIETDYFSPIPAGAVVSILVSQSTVANPATGVLKW